MPTKRPKPRITELSYAPDSALRCQALRHEPWFMFLDSGWPGNKSGRYDIIAARPFLTFSTDGPSTRVMSVHGEYCSEDNPIQLIREALGTPVDQQHDLPFCGGMMGYFGYDLGRRFESVPDIAERDIDMPDMAAGLYDWAVVVDHMLERCWLIGQGRDERTFDEWAQIEAQAQSMMQREMLDPFSVLSEPQANLDWDGYKAAFEQIKRHIRAGDIYQANLTQRFSARMTGDPWGAYLRLREINPAPYSAFMQLSQGAVLSSSPERFLQVRDRTVETRPIKGTRPRSYLLEHDKWLAEELRRSAKDRAENVMIVDLLRNDLGKCCEPGSVQVPSLWAIESYASVHHLVSTVVGRLEAGVHPLELLQACFPGGSITGAPKLRAMQVIETLEPHRRSVYCGAIGYVGFDGAMDTNIAIRTLVHHSNQLHAWAGGGIVWDSKLAAEYQESLDKAAALLKVMSPPTPPS